MEGKPDLAELENEVITNNWYSLGLQLKLEETDLDAIEKESTNNIQTCRRRMFSKWLNTVLHASRKQLLDALRTTAVAEIALAEKYETFILRKYHLSSMESQPKLSQDEELQQVQKNLLLKLPKKKELEKFNQHYDTILEIFSKNPKVFLEIVVKLTEIRLIDSTERDKAKRITCVPIQIRALMKAVNAMIERTAKPQKQLKNFMCVLEPYECFHPIVQDFKKAGYDHDRQIVTKIEEDASQTFHDEAKIDETRTTDPDAVSKYAQYLRAKYEDMPAKPPGWPDVVNWRFFDLDISKSDKTITQLTASKHKDHKVISLHELVNSSTRILVIGAPGIGKSSLSIELCKKWSKGELYGHFKLVILLKLGDSEVQKIKAFEDLIMPKNYQNCIKKLDDCLGKGVLFILEGYNELPDLQSESGRFLSLIKDRLPKASVMVTSQPWATVGINEFFPVQVEILGFTESSRREYVASVLSSDADAFEQELLKVSSHMIKSCLHVPLYLVSVVEIYKQKKEIPKTVTQLYSTLMRTLLVRHYRQFRQLKELEYFSVDVQSSDFFKLPKDIYLDFLKISEIAYETCITGFLPQLSHHFKTLDLLQEIPQSAPELGITPRYSFLHSSVRDFLAAYYISRKKPDDIKRHMQEMQFSPVSSRFSLLFDFLSGFGKNLQLASIKIPFEIVSFAIFRQLCETQNDSLIKKKFELSKMRTITRTFPLPTPCDFWCLGKCIALSRCIWELGFTFRQLSGEHLHMLCNGIKSVGNCQGQIKELNLSLNELDKEGLNQIFNLPPHCLSKLELINLRGNHLNVLPFPEHGAFCSLRSLHKLYFHDNEIAFNGHHPLIQALKNEAKVIRLVSFSNLSSEECGLLFSICSLETIELWEICSDSMMAVANAIGQNTTLKNLKIHQSEVDGRNIDPLPMSLQASKIELLVLSNCAIDSSTAEKIAQAAKNSETLQKLDLSDNLVSCNGHHDHTLVKLLQASHSLRVINLVHNPIYKCKECVQSL